MAKIKRGTGTARIKTQAAKVYKAAHLVRIANEVKRDVVAGTISDKTLKKADRFLAELHNPKANQIRNMIAKSPSQLYMTVNKAQQNAAQAKSKEKRQNEKSKRFDRSVVQLSRRMARQVNDGSLGGQTASAMIKGAGVSIAAAHGSIRFVANHNPVTSVKRVAADVARTARTAALLSVDIRKAKWTAQSVKNALVGVALARAVTIAQSPPRLPILNAHVVKKSLHAGVYAASRLSSSQDTMVSGIGMTAQAAIGTARAIKTSVNISKGGVSVVKTGVKTGVKTVKTGVKTVKYARKNGIVKTAKKALSKAGGSVASAFLNLVAKLGAKAVVPICLIVATVAALNSVTIAPVGAIGSIFGGVYSDKDSNEEINIAEYVKNAVAGYTDEDGTLVKGLRDQYIEDQLNYMDALLDDGYHYAALRRASRITRLSVSQRYDRNGVESKSSPNTSFSGFYSVDEIANVIQPIFNVILFQKYEMEPTEDQAYETIKDIFDDLFVIDVITDDTQFCGEKDSWCGMVHAKVASCYHYKKEYHDSYVCNECDRYICQGHTEYHCLGYEVEIKTCVGHDRMVPVPNAPGGVYMKVYDVHTPYGFITGVSGSERDRYCSGYYGDIYMEPGDACYDDCWVYTYWYDTYYCYDVNDCPHDKGSETFYHGDANHRFTYTEQGENGCVNGILSCTGHNQCLGHRRYIASISMDGISGLMTKYFTNDIDRLSAIETRTEEEEKELAELRDNYEILLELVTAQNDEFGAYSARELRSIQFTEECQTESRENVLTAAISGIGNVGGQPYWSACGYAKHTDWNTCFVYAIMQSAGVTDYTGIDGIDGKTDFSSLTSRLRSLPRFRDSSYSNVKQGDVAILSNGVGIIAGIDEDGNIYVIVGDNGDVCRCLQYRAERINGYYVIN